MSIDSDAVLEIHTKLLEDVEKMKKILVAFEHDGTKITLAKCGSIVEYHKQVLQAYHAVTGLTAEAAADLQKSHGKSKVQVVPVVKETSQADLWAKDAALAQTNEWYRKFQRAESKNQALMAVYEKDKAAWVKSTRDAFARLAREHKPSMNSAFWGNLLLPDTNAGICGINEGVAVFLLNAIVHDHDKPETLFVENNWRMTAMLGETEGHQYRVQNGYAIEHMSAPLYRIHGECDSVNREMISEIENHLEAYQAW